MQEVIIDITRLLGRALDGRLPTGVDRVTLAYIEHFQSRARALVRYGGRWLFMNSADSQRLFQAVLSPSLKPAVVIRWIVARHYLRRNQSCNSQALLFNVSHGGLELPAYASYVKRLGLRAFFFLHDLIPIMHPEYNRAGEVERHRKRVETLCNVAAGMIVNSSVTLASVTEYCSRFSLTLPRSVVAPLASSALPLSDNKAPLEVPYFVMLGTIEPRKNHLMMLELWKQLVLEYGKDAPRLVIIGQRGWECTQVFSLLDRCEILKDHVMELSSCDDAAIATWLTHACALLFPSFAEGFGIPLVEAFACGLPVIASDLPVFHEIAGDIPCYLDPLDAPGWKKAILGYMLPDSEAAAKQRTKLKHYTPPSWDAHFALVDPFLEQA